VIPTPDIFSSRTEGMAARMFADMVSIEVCIHVFEEEAKRREEKRTGVQNPNFIISLPLEQALFTMGEIC
jgi:hypothetical protein